MRPFLPLGLAVCVLVACEASAIKLPDGVTGSNSDGGSDGSDASSPPATLSLRFAHASPDAPTVDVCVTTHGAGFADTKPFLSAHGLAAGLGYAQVSAYASTDFARTGTLDVRLVNGGAKDCASGIAPDLTAEIVDEDAVTLTFAGLVSGQPSIKMVVSGSFLAVKKAAKCTTNFVHAGVGVESAIFDYVSDGVSVAGWGKDAIAFADYYGYIDAEPHAAPVAVRVQAGGSTTTFSSPTFQLSAGDVSLAILLGQSNGSKPLEVLYCHDLTSANGLTNCEVLAASQP